MKKKDKNIAIYIATHKKFDEPNNDIYFSLHVGAEGKNDLGYLKDNNGKNISDKNSNYCELTGLYWMWKNSKEDVVGLVHYRRYFFEKIFQHTKKDIINKENVVKFLSKYDLIVSKKVKIPFYNVYNQYKKRHHIEDYDKCRDIIEKKYPDYLDSFDRISKRRYLHAYNMFIMNKKMLDKYCKWLFDILFELEKNCNIENYSNYDKRIYGFISERLFNVWIDKNNLKIKELFVYNVEDNFIKQLCINFIKKIII